MAGKMALILNSKVLNKMLDKAVRDDSVSFNFFNEGATIAQAIEAKQYSSWEEFKHAHENGTSEFVELEGSSKISDSGVVVLKGCCMSSEMRKLNIIHGAATPPFHKRVMFDYMKRSPGSNALIYPACIAHQRARNLLAKKISIAGKNCMHCYQLACRNPMNGKVFYDENGLRVVRMSKEQADTSITGSTCLYALVRR
ncbi:MAG: hypothetical protein KKH94_08240 [Candidatus Omnitrophica bacterium]|nr:hypothetical protein [Candidatus Omnitrophota bacterium]